VHLLKTVFWLTLRQLRSLSRQPWYVVATVLQPMVWLFLYSQVLVRITEIPGFGAASYISFLTPGILVMTTVMAAGWNGMGILSEMRHGALHRFMVLPISRTAVLLGRVLSIAIISVIQSSILLCVALLMGAHYHNGWRGIFILLLSTTLLSASVAALSNAMAFVMRREESLIGVANFLLSSL
jgi:ABC-2 type transport system permease protein